MFSENLFPPTERGRIMELKNDQKFNLQGHWLSAVINIKQENKNKNKLKSTKGFRNNHR